MSDLDRRRQPDQIQCRAIHARRKRRTRTKLSREKSDSDDGGDSDDGDNDDDDDQEEKRTRSLDPLLEMRLYYQLMEWIEITSDRLID